MRRTVPGTETLFGTSHLQDSSCRKCTGLRMAANADVQPTLFSQAIGWPGCGAHFSQTTAKEEYILVPSKGLEPPHRCRYMDLNHARLPIPPRWQSELQCSGGPKAAVSGRVTGLFYSPRSACQTTRGRFKR